MAQTTTLMTADELLAMPKDGFRTELSEGELLNIEAAYRSASGQ